MLPRADPTSKYAIPLIDRTMDSWDSNPGRFGMITLWVFLVCVMKPDPARSDRFQRELDALYPEAGEALRCEIEFVRQRCDTGFRLRGKSCVGVLINTKHWQKRILTGEIDHQDP